MQVIKEKRSLRLVKPAATVKEDTTPARRGTLVAGVGSYYDRIERYARQIRKTDDVIVIIRILNEALLETRALHSSDEVRAAREQVELAEHKIESLKNELEQLRELVHVDPLTGAFNRGGLDEAFAREMARADRRDSPLCVALLDLDNFKQINDTRGHQAGDKALLHVVNIARQTLRPNDIIARFGGEEFLILLPDTGMESAVSVMYRLQRNLARNIFLNAGQPLPITFSAGITARAPYEHQSTVISRADEALYQAKQTGKNRIVAAPL